MADGCKDDTIQIMNGRNVWILARTDRDAANKEDVLQTAGAVLSRFLGEASPQGSRSIFEVLQSPKAGEGEARFVIGAARPVTVKAFQADTTDSALAQVPSANDRGNVLGTHSQCETLRTVRAQRPWFVTAEFDWRAPSKRTPWPRRRVNALGFPTDDDHDLDWLLLAAAHKGAAIERDTDIVREVTDETAAQIKRSARKAAKKLKHAFTPAMIGFGAALAAAGLFYLVTRPKKPAPQRLTAK